MELYKRIETLFETMSNMAFRLFSNWLMFVAALGLTIAWFFVHDWRTTTMNEAIYHVMIAITFLSFFIIQRTFTHFAQVINLKLNELVTASDSAHNHVIKAEEKSGAEMKEMAKAHDLIVAAEEEKKDGEGEPPVSKIIIL